MSEALPPADGARLAELFAKAIELPESERAAFLAAECGEDARLRKELELLLGAHAGEDHLDAMRAAPPSRTGTRIGAYELLERIGEGGMGEVYAADQTEPVRRRVALKLIKPGMDSAAVVARFEAERQALARMAHPHVAQVYDGGTTEDGRPYFVMELVDGEPITDYCNRQSLSTRERLELFLGICDGVQHAHQKGLIHRDLKPSNLLVMTQDGRAVPKIIDFGVARATTGRLVDRTLHTMVGQVVGTLDYMSPEQADPSDTDLDTRSDVYSLGVVLYQLISGLLPFDLATDGAPLSVIQRTIQERDPPTPSTRLRRQTGTATAIAPLHGTNERVLIRQLTGDLDWICLKALEKEPARRYASASELAEDVRRHLADVPVLARRPGALYRARKFVRRNRVGVTAAALVTVSVLAGLAGLASGWIERLAGERLQVAFEPLEAHYAVSRLHDQAEGLWPPHPEKIEDMEAWIDEAKAQWERHEEWIQLRDAVRPEAEPVQHRMLVELLKGLKALDRDLLDAAAITAEHGWSVPTRLAFAKKMKREFVDPDGLAKEAWEGALPEIRKARADLDGDGVEEEGIYAGFDPPRSARMGLLPIGPDPDSGLWLFLDLATDGRDVDDLSSFVAAASERAGELIRSEETEGLPEESGLVLVLIPGGEFWMGAQWRNREGRNFDEDSRSARSGDPEGGLFLSLHWPLKVEVHWPLKVEVDAFFLSKYEMTRAQWKRIAGHDPIKSEKKSLMSAVGMVDWDDCNTLTSRLGLCLPTEKQWEYAARAGTTDPWSTGREESSLNGFANVFDKSAKAVHKNWFFGINLGSAAAFDDGSPSIEAVGRFDPNPWGLHDVHGNVGEWCLNSPYYYAGRHPAQKKAGIPNSDPDSGFTSVILNRVARGGSARWGPFFARSAFRINHPAAFKNPDLGLRPARAIDPREP